MNVVSRNINSLKDDLVNKDVSYGGISEYDILMTTFEYIIRDETLINATEELILIRFAYKYKMFMFRVIKNERLKLKINADDLQTKKRPEPGE